MLIASGAASRSTAMLQKLVAYINVAQHCQGGPSRRNADHIARQVKAPARMERARAATSPGPTAANTPRCARLYRGAIRCICGGTSGQRPSAAARADE